MRASAVLAIAVAVCAIGCNAARPTPTVSPTPAAAPVPTAAPIAVDAALAPDAPAPVVELTDTTWHHGELVANDHVCALRPDGRVMCWGTNSYGQVGDVAGVDHPIPILVPGVAHATSLAAGPLSTCAIVDGGHVWCWGGAGDATTNAPAAVPALDDVVELALTASAECARRRDGTIWCWVASTRATVAAVEMTALERARQVVSGYQYACALGVDARVRCLSWFSRADGKPATAELEITDARGAVRLATFFSNTCAVLADGHVVCWSIAASPVPRLDAVSTVDGLGDAVDLVGGLAEFCAARRGGGVVCFQPIPAAGVVPRVADELRGFRAIAFAMAGNCGVRAGGEIACWGQDFGPLGRRAQSGARPTPAAVPDLHDATSLSVEYARACAHRKSGDVVCWVTPDPYSGWTAAGVPAMPAAAAVLGVAKMDTLASGAAFTCARGGGKTACWGVQSWLPCHPTPHGGCKQQRVESPAIVDGLLGIAGATALAEPCVLVDGGKVTCVRPSGEVKPVPIDHAIAISARCAVRRGGAVSCWTEDGKDDKVTEIAGITASAVASGFAHDCALQTDGRVACWGRNFVGQLGDGTRTDRTTPHVVGGLAEIVEIAAAKNTTCARARSGAVSCWGANEDGALGDGGGRDQLHPVAVAGLTDAVELHGMVTHWCARRRSGDVACWGHDSLYNLPVTTPATAITVLEPDVID